MALPSSPRCHVCGRSLEERWASATDTEYGTTDERFTYYRCPDCDALSIHPLPADRLAEIYPPTYYSFVSGGSGTGLAARVKNAIDARAYRRAAAMLTTDAPAILDIGGGTGEISAAFKRESGDRASVTVVDLDGPSIEEAERRGLHGFVGRIEDFESDEQFDLVLAMNLIEHVAEPIAVLEKSRGLLAPGGLLWLQTPNFRSLDARIYRHRNWAGYHCPRHWVIFSEEGLRHALQRAGLEPALFKRTQGAPFWAGSLLGLGRIKNPTVPGGLPKPLVDHRSFAPLAAAGAAFDFATRPVRAVSQVMVLARPGAVGEAI